MSNTGVFIVTVAIVAGIYDAVKFLRTGEGTTISRWMQKYSLKSPLGMCVIMFLCGHFFGYMPPEDLLKEKTEPSPVVETEESDEPIVVGAAPRTPKIRVYFSPHGGYEKSAPACVDVICELIKNEKTSIHVRAYSFTSKPIGEALCEAAKRGVKISIIADRSNRTDKNSICPMCRDAGCGVVFDDNHPISHGKIMVFGRKISVVGSYNFSANAERNAETIVVINDKSVAEKLIADFDHHHAHSEK